MPAEVLVEVKNLKKYFPMKTGDFLKRQITSLKAVDDVSFSIKKGETLGLVGESGCGKTTCGRTILRVYEPTEGQILYQNKDIAHLPKKKLLPYRKEMQMIFQDPYASLDPRMMVGDIVAEGLRAHYPMSKKEGLAKASSFLEKVGLSKEHANRYPHEFSGGQRQRIGIARALALSPQFIICDEPISALDVSIQAQVINLLESLQEEFELTYLFIAHDLCMVKHISTHIAVMYLGHIVEIGSSNEVYNTPTHPYTQALLSAVPLPDPDLAQAKVRIKLEGEIPSPINVPKGCPFSGRCIHVMPQCKESRPELKAVSPGHQAACFLY